MQHQSRKSLIIGTMLLLAILTALPAKAQLHVGDTAPEFKLKQVNAKGQVALSDFRDKKIVIVHFWKSK